MQLLQEEKLEPLKNITDDPRIRLLNRLYARKRKELKEKEKLKVVFLFTNYYFLSSIFTYEWVNPDYIWINRTNFDPYKSSFWPLPNPSDPPNLPPLASMYSFGNKVIPFCMPYFRLKVAVSWFSECWGWSRACGRSFSGWTLVIYKWRKWRYLFTSPISSVCITFISSPFLRYTHTHTKTHFLIFLCWWFYSLIRLLKWYFFVLLIYIHMLIIWYYIDL